MSWFVVSVVSVVGAILSITIGFLIGELLIIVLRSVIAISKAIRDYWKKVK